MATEAASPPILGILKSRMIKEYVYPLAYVSLIFFTANIPSMQ